MCVIPCKITSGILKKDTVRYARGRKEFKPTFILSSRVHRHVCTAARQLCKAREGGCTEAELGPGGMGIVSIVPVPLADSTGDKFAECNIRLMEGDGKIFHLWGAHWKRLKGFLEPIWIIEVDTERN